jgi:hypothetical protein
MKPYSELTDEELLVAQREMGEISNPLHDTAYHAIVDLELATRFKAKCEELAATVRVMNENARLVLEAQKELKDINDTYNSIVNESCNGTDNRQHCACVPALRAEIKRLNKVDENLEQSLET